MRGIDTFTEPFEEDFSWTSVFLGVLIGVAGIVLYRRKNP